MAGMTMGAFPTNPASFETAEDFATWWIGVRVAAGADPARFANRRPAPCDCDFDGCLGWQMLLVD